jgi:hypothetical protein
MRHIHESKKTGFGVLTAIKALCLFSISITFNVRLKADILQRIQYKYVDLWHKKACRQGEKFYSFFYGQLGVGSVGVNVYKKIVEKNAQWRLDPEVGRTIKEKVVNL